MPDTISYLYLGLGVIAIILGGYIGSVIVRFRNAYQDMRLIEQLADN